MNTNPGTLALKLGMTQLVTPATGEIIPCTVVDVTSVVVGKRTEEKDGYTALIIGLGSRREKVTNKPLKGFFEKNKIEPKQHLREFRCTPEYAATLEIGASMDASALFEKGQFVDVKSVSKGHGFTGVMVRYHFRGAKRSHGANEVMRHGGSIGTNMTPGRVFKGRKMAGQHGNKVVSVLNQKVAEVLAEDGLVLICGGVPGSKNAIVELRGAVKKNGGKSSE